MHLANVIARWAPRRTDAAAVIDGTRQWTWRQLDGDVASWAEGLARAGVKRGDRVAVVSLNRGEILVLLFACARLGASLVPVNWRLTAEEQAWIVDDADCAALVGEADPLDRLLPALGERGALVVVGLPEADGRVGAGAVPATEIVSVPAAGDLPAGSWEDPVLLVYTSGTTGRPKGAVLTQSAVGSNAVNSVHMHDLVVDDIVLTVAPLFHVGGLTIQTTPALLSGATVVLHRRFDPGAWLAAVAERRATLSVLVPTMITALLEHPAWPDTDLSSLRMLTTGSQVVPVDLLRAVHRRGVPVAQVYGATETGPIALCQRREEAMATEGTVGREATLCEVRIVDRQGNDVAASQAGELWVRSPSLFQGYWRRPEATADALVDGWYRTGDVGHRRPDGNVVVSDRIKEVVITGGENVYPAEVEAAIAATGLVTDVAVVGQSDERWGEVPVAFVVAGDDAGPLDRGRLVAALTDRLARYKHPRSVVAVDALPRNAMGKILKHELRARLPARPDAS